MNVDTKTLTTVSAKTILTTDYPDPVWAVPNILPTGLAILAGAPKLGKSWLALQIAQSVASGGIALGQRVELGAVLVCALEDSPRRLQERMIKQGWTRNLDADFLCLGQFENEIGDFRGGGGEKLAKAIEERGYKFIAIDTLSRTVKGDQNDVAIITRGLTPLQQIAHEKNCSILMIDHHHKTRLENPDAISDVLGSTAKGAVCDTILGLYRERGKADAKLRITGRDIQEQTLALKMDWQLGCWQCEGNADEIQITERRQDILTALRDLGESQLDTIANALAQDRGNVYRRIQDLVSIGKVNRVPKGQRVYYSLIGI
jgi:RecA-family ATPase